MRAPTEGFQQVKQPLPAVPFKVDPAYAPGGWVTNIVRRVLNVDIQTIKSNWSDAGSQDDSWNDLGDFPQATQRIDIYSEDYGLDIRLRNSEGDALQDFFVPADRYVTIDGAFHGISIKCHEAAATTDYQIVAWF